MLRDESPTPATAPALIVAPGTAADVQALVVIAGALALPVVPRGARTGLVGGCVPRSPSLVVDTSRMREVHRLDIAGRTLRIGPGATLGEIEELLRPHGMMYPPDPASYRRASIGGTVATNAGGLRCVKYGVTDRWVRTLDVVLADGSLVTLGHDVAKDATGYDLTRLFVGSEGTLGIIVGVGITFCPAPAESRLMLAAFASAAGAAAAVATLCARVTPAMCELLDAGALGSRDTGALVPALGSPAGWGADPTLLMVQVDGSHAEAEAEAILARAALELAGGRVVEVAAAHTDAILDMRRGGSAVRTAGGEPSAEALVDPGMPQPTLPQDLSVPVARLGQTIAAIRRIASTHRVQTRIAAHAGDGNLHLLLLTDAAGAEAGAAARAGAAQLRGAMGEIIDAVLASGGTVSGEHGIGSLKRDWAARDLGARTIELHRSTQRAFDPHSLMNPGTGF
nr:FAD-linked oxidase C-terminal domain-containing protein [Leucobacter luti]